MAELSASSASSIPAAAPRRRKASIAPVNEEEAQRRKLFYSELRRHHRAFGLPESSRVVQETAAAEREDEAANGQQQQQDGRPGEGKEDADGEGGGDEDAEPHSSELYMELMEDDFGPIEENDAGFMRNFPKVFESWETFDETLERYTKGTFQIMRKHMTQTTVSRNKGTLKYLSTQMIPGTFIGSFYPERFEWYKKVLVCAICRAASAREKKLSNRPAGNTVLNRDTDAKVTAHLQPESDKSKHFVIEVTWSGAHNHRCDEAELAKFKQGASRLDDPVLLSLVQKMRKEKKDARDVKRFIYEATGRLSHVFNAFAWWCELLYCIVPNVGYLTNIAVCLGKKCSTKDVHAMYQRMNTPGDDHNNNNNGDEEDEGDSGPDDSAFDFFNEHQNHIASSGFTARSGSATVAASQSMEFDPMTGRLRPMVLQVERNLVVVQQNIARLAETLTLHDQTELASTLQAAMNAWTSKRTNKSVNVNNNVVGMQHHQQQQSSMSSFQSPPPPSYMSGGMLPSSYEYPRRFENNEGADLLMGLDAPTSVFGSGGVANMRSGGQQKRRRQ